MLLYSFADIIIIVIIITIIIIIIIIINIIIIIIIIINIIIIIIIINIIIIIISSSSMVSLYVVVAVSQGVTRDVLVSSAKHRLWQQRLMQRCLSLMKKSDRREASIRHQSVR